MTISRAEVITSVERRRRWSRDEKERVVAASLEPGATISEVARVAGLHVSQLFRWRKEPCKHGETSVAPFVPVETGPSMPVRDVAEARSTRAVSSPMSGCRTRFHEALRDLVRARHASGQDVRCIRIQAFMLRGDLRSGVRPGVES